MSYTKTTWRNNQSPAINADNLNHIEQGIYDAHDGLASANNNMELMDNRLQAEIDDANSDISTLESNLAAETSARTQQDSVLSARMDTFTQLPSGSTSGDAELIDIRVGADGTTYSTAGDAVRGQVSDLKSNLDEIYDGTPSNKLFSGNDESNYWATSGATGAYLSNKPISAGKYITYIKIKTAGASEGAIKLIDTSTSKVVASVPVSLASGWNTLYLGIKTPSECYIAFYGTTALYSYTASATNWEGYYFNNGAGLYEMSPANAYVGDTVTISSSTTNRYFAFAIQYNVADGVLFDSIEKAINENDLSLYNSVATPKLLTNESDYSRASADSSVYFSNRTIPANSVLKQVKVKSGASTIGRIVIINADTQVVTHAFPIVFSTGWNTILLNTTISVDSWIGFEKTNALFNSSSDYVKESLCTDGLYEGTPVYANVGDTLSVTQTASNVLFAFAVQWEYENGDVASVANGLDEYYQGINEPKPTFKLNNGTLLSYENISDTIGYMGRWFDYNGKPCTNNDGSELYFKTIGASTITANFGQITTQQVTPYIAVSIDGGAFARQQISTPTITLPNTNEHIVRIVIDGMTEADGGDKWLGTIGVYVDSITVDAGAISGIYPRNKVGMFFGDSITEGINALGTGATATQNSAINAFPYFCCEELNAVSYRVGYGGTGLLTSGSFRYCSRAIDYYYNNHPVGNFVPDFIVINHGVNDYQNGKTASEYIAEYNNIIGKLRVKYSAVPIFCIVPFKAVQPYATEMKAMCDNYSNTYFVDSYAWNGDTVDGTHLSVAGAENNGKLLAKVIKEVLGTSYFINLH